MAQNSKSSRVTESIQKPIESNVKKSKKYSRFGETIRYLTLEELHLFFDSIVDYRHKLMMRTVYELGCRVGEFVRIQLKHLELRKSAVHIPPENTKTGHRRMSHLPQGLMNELASLLKSEGRISKRHDKIRRPDSYLFHSPGKPNQHYSENRLRQIFNHYLEKAGLDREYGLDSSGRKLRQITIHSLRHSHIMTYIHECKLPLPIVQKQVGHRTLRATSVYLNPSNEAVGNAYEEVRKKNAKSSSCYSDPDTQRFKKKRVVPMG